MKLLYSIAMIVVGFVLLVKGADMFVDNASGIAKKLKVSPVVVGLTIVGFRYIAAGAGGKCDSGIAGI